MILNLKSLCSNHLQGLLSGQKERVDKSKVTLLRRLRNNFNGSNA